MHKDNKDSMTQGRNNDAHCQHYLLNMQSSPNYDFNQSDDAQQTASGDNINNGKQLGNLFRELENATS